MAAAAYPYPPWVILEHDCAREIDGCSSSIADTKTLARCRTTAGDPISVALCLAAAPEGSRVCVQLPAGVQASKAVVLAAHGDSVLVRVVAIANQIENRSRSSTTTDHFVYSAGDAAAEPPRPPSLLLLPPPRRHLRTESTGLLRRGEDGEFLVAELRIEGATTTPYEAELQLLRSSSGEWCVKRSVVSRYSDGGETMAVNLASHWRNSVVVPVGDQMLCWVDFANGLLFAHDVFDESPSLWFVPLPEDTGHLGARNVCVTGGGSTMKFVNVFSRCCCGAAGQSTCAASFDAYAVHTWTLRMEDMTWAMDGSIDATQLWSLDGYEGLPRVMLGSPVVSMDEEHTICFEVREENHRDNAVWRIMVDMKSRMLRSVFRYPEGRRCRSWVLPLSSRVSTYFNSKPSRDQLPSPAAQQAEATVKLANTRTMQQADSSELSDVLAALQEIPGLERDDMLKAYRILTHDDSGRRFRSLMGLPMEFRKDCVLMEIKASETCVLCSVHAPLICKLQLKE